jgi:hypothetical protein
MISVHVAMVDQSFGKAVDERRHHGWILYGLDLGGSRTLFATHTVLVVPNFKAVIVRRT